MCSGLHRTGERSIGVTANAPVSKTGNASGLNPERSGFESQMLHMKTKLVYICPCCGAYSDFLQKDLDVVLDHLVKEGVGVPRLSCKEELGGSTPPLGS
jgi:hypothetical protein